MSAEPDTIEMPSDGEIVEQAARYFGSTAEALKIDFGALTHPGKVRAHNEDHYCVVRRQRSRDILLSNMPEGALREKSAVAYTMVVADGIGGAAFGELASMFAIQAGWDWGARAYKWHFKMSELHIQEVMEQLKIHGQLIHQALLERARTDLKLAGMGTTLTGAIFVDNDVFVAHLGDSRAYLYRGGVLQQLTRDHTKAQQLADAGIIPSAADAPRFLRHILVNCLGADASEVKVEVHHLPLAAGDRLLLCSDGLTDEVSDGAIAQTLGRCPVPTDACEALVALALDHGGKDNITVVLARVAE